MRRTYNKKMVLTAIAAVASVCQSGCQTPPRAAGYAGGYDPAYGNYGQQVLAGPQAAGAIPQGALPAVPTPYAAVAEQQTYSANQYQALESTALGLKDRLERVEKAMLRLDRRMQLVERNELNRMSGAVSAGAQVSMGSAAAVNGSEEQAAMRSLNIGPPQQVAAEAPLLKEGEIYQEGFRPVSTKEDGVIHSALQAAPQGEVNRMPSLADTSPAAGKAPKAASDVAVWTVRYESDKVWPDRAQLPSSRDVVEALRESGNVTLFARGPNPNDKQFRERVKALSRYLSKVSSVESVPIAALPSPQLDTETIEILATH